jgi:hypothetical protein
MLNPQILNLYSYVKDLGSVVWFGGGVKGWGDIFQGSICKGCFRLSQDNTFMSLDVFTLWIKK